MAQDPVLRLAQQRIIKASADLEVQLSTKSGGAPTIVILRRLRDRAADSLAALAFVDPADIKKVRTLQNEVKRYDEWIVWMREIINEGIVYDKAFTDAERDEMLDYLLTTPQGEQEAADLGLIVPGLQQDG